MKLSKFIKESVSEILLGLESCQNSKYKFGLHKDTGIEFDVAIINKSSTTAKAGLEVLSIGASAKANMLNGNMHRLRFKVYARGK